MEGGVSERKDNSGRSGDPERKDKSGWVVTLRGKTRVRVVVRQELEGW